MNNTYPKLNEKRKNAENKFSPVVALVFPYLINIGIEIENKIFPMFLTYELPIY